MRLAGSRAAGVFRGLSGLAERGWFDGDSVFAEDSNGLVVGDFDGC